MEVNYQHFSGTKPIICPIDPFNLLSIVILSTGGRQIVLVRRGSAPWIPAQKEGLLTSTVYVLYCAIGQSSTHHIHIIFDTQETTSRKECVVKSLPSCLPCSENIIHTYSTNLPDQSAQGRSVVCGGAR